MSRARFGPTHRSSFRQLVSVDSRKEPVVDRDASMRQYLAQAFIFGVFFASRHVGGELANNVERHIQPPCTAQTLL